MGGWPEDASALEFVTPGFIHALGNALFKVEGRARLLGAVEGGGAHGDAVLEACSEARALLALMRMLSGGGAGNQRLRACLTTVCEVLRVPLRELGVSVRLAEGRRGPTVVGAAVARATVLAARAVAREAPAGLAGALELGVGADVEGMAVVWMALRNGPGVLPFAADLDAAVRSLRPRLAPDGVRVELRRPGSLRLLVPAVAGATPGAHLREP